MAKFENNLNQSDDLGEIIINTFRFIKKHLMLLLLFSTIGVGIGYITSIITPNKFATSFVIENGGLPTEIVKVIAYPVSTQNLTNQSYKDYEKGISILQNITLLIVDTTESKQTIKYNIILSDTTDIKSIENVIISFLKTNKYACNYIDEERLRIKNEITSTNKIIEKITANLDSSSIFFAEKNLSELLKRNENLNQKLKKLGRFNIVRPMDNIGNDSLEFSTFLFIGTTLGIILGIVWGYLKDLFYRMK